MDKYQKIKKIGEGSFGTAYLVKSKKDGSQYVIKEINISRMQRKEREEARKEVAVLAQMKHPNIVAYRESFEEIGSLYICMDYCDGGDLYSKINSQRGMLFNEDQVLDWFVQICLAMKHIHDRKILHRDIKSQNIFSTKRGVIKLGDFGIAKVLNSTVELARTCIGTPYYLSPEIVENQPYNNKSDVWSLGCVLYELTTLKHAFEAGNMKNLVLKIIRGSYPPVSPRYSYDLRNLIAALFKRNPRDRPSVNSILRKNFIQKKIAKFLTETKRSDEFSHTVMHGQKVAKDLRALPARPLPKPAAAPVRPASAVSRPASAASRPSSARSQAGGGAKKPNEVKKSNNRPAAGRYNPANVYAPSSARQSKETPRKSADYKQRPVSAGGQAGSSQEALAKKRQELQEREKKRREAARKQEQNYARQHRELVEKQRMMMNVPAPQQDRGKYEQYHAYLDKLQNDMVGRAMNQAPVRNAPSPVLAPAAAKREIESRQAGRNAAYRGAQAAERARVVNEFISRKKEAAANKKRAQAEILHGPYSRPTSAQAAGDGNRLPNRAPSAQNRQEEEYLKRLGQIRQQNLQERRVVRNDGAGDISANDAEIRKKKIEALKAQADERAKKLKEQLEQKRKDAYEKEKEQQQQQKQFNRDNRVPAHRAVPVSSPAPVIPMTNVMKAIGVSVDDEQKTEPEKLEREKTAVQKKKEEILKRINEKPPVKERPKWGAAVEMDPAKERPKWGVGAGDGKPLFANLPLEVTSSAMEATSSHDVVIKHAVVATPEKTPAEEAADPPGSSRKQWGGAPKTVLVALEKASVIVDSTTITMPEDEKESPTKGNRKQNVAFTIDIEEETTPPAPPVRSGTVIIDKPSVDTSNSDVPTDTPPSVTNAPSAEAMSMNSKTQVIEKDMTSKTQVLDKKSEEIAENKDSEEKLSEKEKPSEEKPSKTEEVSEEEEKCSDNSSEKDKLEVGAEKQGSVVCSKTIKLPTLTVTSSPPSAVLPSNDENLEVIDISPQPSVITCDKPPAQPITDAWLKEKPDAPEQKPEESKPDESKPEESNMATKQEESSQKSEEVSASLMDKVELDEDEDENRPRSQINLGLTTGQFDCAQASLLRTCSMPDLSKLFKTIESPAKSPEKTPISQSLDLAIMDDSKQSLDLDVDDIEEDYVDDDDDDEINDDTNFGDGDRFFDDDDDDDDDNDDDEDDDLLTVMESMENILHKTDMDTSGETNDSITKDENEDASLEDGDNEDEEIDEDMNEDDIVIGQTIIPGKEEWQSDSSDYDDDNNEEHGATRDEVFSRLEETRANLEEQLGFDRFIEAYKAVQAIHEDEDESIEDCSKVVTKILGDQNHLYDKILRLVIADGAYTEDNE
ncbi:serine/threonine-protein kinase Nek1-like isoform X2 [Tubulanus polymorphus]|uniref:serine/threonine-protein kinase Nek1-like isoform X2 n=1 Tax=Tubulanus polymorphus TaxID=672921 RepID=UPI003DA43E67